MDHLGVNGYLDNLSRHKKQLIIFGLDLAIIPFCLYGAAILRADGVVLQAEHDEYVTFIPLLMVLAGGMAHQFGLHRLKLHAFGQGDIMRLGAFALSFTLAAVACKSLFGFDIPVSVLVISGALIFLGQLLLRIGGLRILKELNNLGSNPSRVVIYGAGGAGIQLIAGLRQSREVRPVSFVDDNRALQGIMVAGLLVRNPADLEQIVNDQKIDRILLAMPSVPLSRHKRIERRLQHLPCQVLSVPSLIELVNGQSLDQNLTPVSPCALLGRENIDLDVPGVEKSYRGKSVFISGAGGSIGAELSRQLIGLNPKKLVLFEQSELALYQIELELAPLAQQRGIKLIPVIGSVCDGTLITRLFRRHRFHTILHAAAYKHVPLLETNEIAGLYNNVIGTRVLAAAARNCEVDRFILISSDKAVRPANVMGATKRLAELVVQDMALRSDHTLFSMVRFGNVLGSSGSVIPLFLKQIAQGGPLTLTHADVTRYFMTIPEAARLVLMAGSFAKGGDVFVLDMGKSIKIHALARRLIELSGRVVRDTTHPEGDIEIIETGLRPGEKLYEELLISKDMLSTPHTKILRAQEAALSAHEMAVVLQDIQAVIRRGDPNGVRMLLARWVEGYEQPVAQLDAG